MKKYFVFIIAFIFACTLLSAPNLYASCNNKRCFFESMNEVYEKIDFRVLRVIDGDTVIIEYFGVPTQVRVLGIDTPETKHPYKPLECYGNKATKYTNKLITNKRVKLWADPLNEDRDPYGRLLRYVYLENGTNLSYLLVAEGLATVFREYPSSFMSDLVKLEEIAKNRTKNIWSKECDL